MPEMSAETGLTDGNNVDINGFEYEYEYLPESDTYCLVKGADIENVVIPYQYNGKVILGVGEKAFFGYRHVKKVTAEEGDSRGKIRIRIDKPRLRNVKILEMLDLRKERN